MRTMVKQMKPKRKWTAACSSGNKETLSVLFQLIFLWTCKNLEHFLPNSLDMKVNGALTRSITVAVTKTTEETPDKQWAVEWRKLELIGITPQ